MEVFTLQEHPVHSTVVLTAMAVFSTDPQSSLGRVVGSYSNFIDKKIELWKREGHLMFCPSSGWCVCQPEFLQLVHFLTCVDVGKALLFPCHSDPQASSGILLRV